MPRMSGNLKFIPGVFGFFLVAEQVYACPACVVSEANAKAGATLGAFALMGLVPIVIAIGTIFLIKRVQDGEKNING